MSHRLPTLSVTASLAALLLGTAALGMGPVAPVAASVPSTVGGPLLASHGVVVNAAPGAPALPAAAQLPAASWLVADATTGQVLAAKDAHGQFLPASTLKMLTAVTLIPRLDPDRTVAVNRHDEDVDGTRVGLVSSLRYTVRKLFTCLLVVSANDAADTLAQAAGGTTRTLALMNAEAHRLQADDTVARTPSGLDAPGEHSSAYDLALIARQGLTMPAFRGYVGTVHSRVPAPHGHHFAIWTHNELLTTYRGDIGVKNGYTVAARGTDVNAATRHGHTVIVTVMHADPDFWPMVRSLLDWGFAADGKVQPVGTLVAPLPAAAAAGTTTAEPRVAAGAQLPTASGLHRSPAGDHRGWVAAGVAAAVLLAAGVCGRNRRRNRRRPRPMRSAYRR